MLMRVQIRKAGDKTYIECRIKDRFKLHLPSVKDGWRFNFNKHSKVKGAHTYILITEETPEVIEGCLNYRFDERAGIYIAYFEIAPHNRGKDKKYELVGECLMAYAGRLSYEWIEGLNRGYLTFDVKEEKEQDEKKLKELYAKKYGAIAIKGLTAMYIDPENTSKLIEKYLRI